MIAVSNRIPARQLTSEARAEMILLELQLSLALVVGCLYIPPMCCDDVFNAVSTSLHSLCLENDILLLGDFDAPDVDWNSLSASSRLSTALCDLVFDMNLVQLVDGSTHKRGNTLDLVLSNCSERVLVTSNNAVAVSDHNVISLQVQSGFTHRVDTLSPFKSDHRMVSFKLNRSTFGSCHTQL